MQRTCKTCLGCCFPTFGLQMICLLMMLFRPCCLHASVSSLILRIEIRSPSFPLIHLLSSCFSMKSIQFKSGIFFNCISFIQQTSSFTSQLQLIILTMTMTMTTRSSSSVWFLFNKESDRGDLQFTSLTALTATLDVSYVKLKAVVSLF